MKIKMKKYNISYHKDVSGRPYYAIDVDRETIGKYIVQLREEVIDLELFNRLTTNQSRRDSNKYHITVLNAATTGSLIKEKGILQFTEIINALEDIDLVDIKLLGLGIATKGGSLSYYVVVQSNQIDEIRTTMGYNKIDLHITIGFDPTDVFGVTKTQLVAPYNRFKTILSNKFYSNGESFEFIRSTPGFDGNSDLITPIFIGNSWITFRIGDFGYISVSLVDDKLRVTNSWKDTKIKPMLAHTIVCRQLKKFNQPI